MAAPVEIMGKTYLASLPTLKDFDGFKEYLATRIRRDGYAAIPPDASDTDFKRFVRVIDERCDAIKPFDTLSEVAATDEGVALLFYSLLRRENQNMTLDWVKGFVTRAKEGDEDAIKACGNLRRALPELLAAKKNENATKGPKVTAKRRR